MSNKSVRLTKNQCNMLSEARIPLHERTSSVVYHWTTLGVALKILEENKFRLMNNTFKSGEENVIGTSHKRMYYMSTTRNGKIGMGGYSHNDTTWVRFSLDGDMLNSNFHIKGIDYWGGGEFSMNFRLSNRSEFTNKIPKDDGNTETEDRIYSRKPIIEHADKFIKQIDVYIPIDNDKSFYSADYKAHNISTAYALSWL